MLLFTTWHICVLAQELTFVEWDEVSEFSVAMGEDPYITLSFLIKDGYHIQANKTEDENLIPTTLFIEASDALVLGDPVFPPSVAFSMRGVKEPLQVFSEVLAIRVPIPTDQSAKRGVYVVEGKLHYQACDASKCYFPRDLSFVLSINLQ